MRKQLLRLYPEGWRRRYGEEFLALLEDLPLTPPVLWDVLKATLVARYEPRVLEEVTLPSMDETSRPLRVITVSAVLITSVIFAIGMSLSRPLGLLTLPVAALALLAGLVSAGPIWHACRER